MKPDTDEDITNYKVVINHEEQYSIWPTHRANPSGWTDVGKEGKKSDCLGYIAEVWTDMRPRSLRESMTSAQAKTDSVHEEKNIQ